MLLKTTTGSPTSNLDLSDMSHDNTPDRQPVPTLNINDVHKHKTTSPKTLTNQTHLNTCPQTLSQILNKRKQNKSLGT